MYGEIKYNRSLEFFIKSSIAADNPFVLKKLTIHLPHYNLQLANKIKVSFILTSVLIGNAQNVMRSERGLIGKRDGG